MNEEGLVLLAHGSRDSRWRKPFETIADKVAREIAPMKVRLAYMEFSEPTLEQTIDELAGNTSIKKIVVIPLFMASGGHLTSDVPQLVRNSKKKHPSLEISTTPPIGECPRVQESMIAEVQALVEKKQETP